MSDLTLASAPFAPSAIDPQTAAFNDGLMKAAGSMQPWWEVGAPKARELRDAGAGPFPKPVLLPQASVAACPSRDAGRAIPLRVIPPSAGASSTGVYLHYHGGGWVLSHEASQDPLLAWIADTLRVTVVSVGYRRAPEDPFPAGPNDCFDAAEYLVDNARRLYDGDLLYVGGESAGAHLSLVTLLHLLKARPKFHFKAAVLSYGCFNLGELLPSAKNFALPLVLTKATMAHFIDAATPGLTPQQRTDPAISPMYAELAVLLKDAGHEKLPPAFFAVGTLDALLDDTVLMSTKWLATGSEARVKVYPGAPHGFNTMPPHMCPVSQVWRQDFEKWVKNL